MFHGDKWDFLCIFRAQDKVCEFNLNRLYLCYFLTKSNVWLLVRIVSMRRFLQVVKYWIWSRNRHYRNKNKHRIWSPAFYVFWWCSRDDENWLFDIDGASFWCMYLPLFTDESLTNILLNLIFNTPSGVVMWKSVKFSPLPVQRCCLFFICTQCTLIIAFMTTSLWSFDVMPV